MLYVIKCLIRVWNVKYNSVHCAANLLAGVVQYHVSFRCNSCLSLSTSLVEVYHHYYFYQDDDDDDNDYYCYYYYYYYYYYSLIEKDHLGDRSPEKDCCY